MQSDTLAKLKLNLKMGISPSDNIVVTVTHFSCLSYENVIDAQGQGSGCQVEKAKTKLYTRIKY